MNTVHQNNDSRGAGSAEITASAGAETVVKCGMLTSVDARRRWFGTFFLILAGGMLGWGLTFLERPLVENPAMFVFYWVGCFGLTMVAFCIALYDLRVMRRRIRDEQKRAFARAFEDIVKEEANASER